MKKQYSFIQFPYDFPLSISLKKVTNHEKDWHTIVKILYILEGNAEIKIHGKIYYLKPDDIILVNPWHIYELVAPQELAYLEVGIDFSKYKLPLNDMDNVLFDCNSTIDKDKRNFKILKESIFALIRVNTKTRSYLDFFNSAMAYQILYLMMNQYKVQGNEERKISHKYFDVLKEIIQYIDLHYKDSLTLNDLSAFFGYTPQYFSSFFNKHMNQNFQSYYDSLRVNKSIELLKKTDYPLESIALDFGFSDYRSYIRAFKNTFNVTPSEFRKNQQQSKEDKQISYLSFDTNHYLDIIFKFAGMGIDNQTSTIQHAIKIQTDFSKKGTEIRKTFLNVLGVGRACDLLRQNIRTVLEQTQKEIGYKYIKFHGLFSDEMHIYKKVANQPASYSFVFIDQVFDYLKSIHLKPFLQLSYMPKDMAKKPNKTVFECKYISSEPIDYKEWQDLLIQFFHHMINKYTFDEVISWPITLWNEPDSTIHAFGFEDEQDFFKFYQITYETIKSISTKFIIGSPALIPFASWAIDWDKRFLKFAEENQCYPEFLNVHYYSNDFDFFITGKKTEELNKNPNNLKDYIAKVKNPEFYKGDTIYLTGWNVTSSRRNYLNDTIYLSCYLVKNILENMDELESFTKWSLTDFIDETQLPNTTYHGGLGLFTYNGICKAAYAGLRLLSKLGNTVIEQGDGYYITKNKENIQIIIYNYEHFSDLYADGEYFSLKEHSRYDPFQMNKNNHYSFHFTNLPFASAKIKETRITRESGSSYDIYENISNLEFENVDETTDLKKLSTPKYRLFEKNIENQELSLDFDAGSLEVKLIEIRLLKNKPL